MPALAALTGLAALLAALVLLTHAALLALLILAAAVTLLVLLVGLLLLGVVVLLLLTAGLVLLTLVHVVVLAHSRSFLLGSRSVVAARHKGPSRKVVRLGFRHFRKCPCRRFAAGGWGANGRSR